MNEQTHCILIIRHDAENSYSKNAFARAMGAIKDGKGIVPIGKETFAVAFPDAIKTLLEIASIEMRTDRVRKLHFCLIPCGSRVFGELPTEVAKALGALGLSYSETPFPEPPPPC